MRARKQERRERESERGSQSESRRESERKKHFSARGPVNSGRHGNVLPPTQLSGHVAESVTAAPHFPHVHTQHGAVNSHTRTHTHTHVRVRPVG